MGVNRGGSGVLSGCVGGETVGVGLGGGGTEVGLVMMLVGLERHNHRQVIQCNQIVYQKL